MAKIFEDYFSELQADMVSICLEYVEKRADTIYIYASLEGNSIDADFFFRINGTLAQRHELDIFSTNEFTYNTSDERQFAVLNILNEDMNKIDELCKLYNRETPTEIKMIYDVNNNHLASNCKYDLIHSNDTDKTGMDIAEDWFDELRNL